MSTTVEPKKTTLVKGGSFLIDEQPAAEIFTAEDFT